MRLITIMLGAALAGLALFEVMMQPSPAERIELGSIFGGMAVLAAASAWLLPRLARRTRSIRLTLGLLAIAGISVVIAAALAVGTRMFISDHDLQLLLVVSGFGGLAALAFAVTVSGPLSGDIDTLSRKAAHVAEGNFDPAVPIERRDEVGRLGEALARMIERLEEAESAREADEQARRVLFSSVGHDLRTPLASLRASLEALQDGVSESPSKSLQIMERDIDALTRLVDDLNLLARLDSGTLSLELAEIDVTEIADEALDVLRPIARSRRVSLRLAADGRVKALGHSEHVGRALRNLIDNAIRHAPESTEVTVGIRRGNGSAVVLVTDQGPGFDPDFAETAFDRFTRADPSRLRDTGGSGLGLAIVRGLITALDGEVWIDPGPRGRVGLKLPAPERARR